MLLVISCILHSHFSSMKKGLAPWMGLNLKSFLTVFCRGLTLKREGKLDATILLVVLVCSSVASFS